MGRKYRIYGFNSAAHYFALPDARLIFTSTPSYFVENTVSQSRNVTAVRHCLKYSECPYG